MTTTQAALLEAQSIRAIVAKMRADLASVGGFDNELLGVPAGGVRAHIEALEAALRAADAAQPEPFCWANPAIALPDDEDEAQGWTARVSKTRDAVFSMPLYAAPPQPAPIAAQADDELLKRLDSHEYWKVTDTMEMIPAAAAEIRRLRAALAAQAGPALVPLTDEQIAAAWDAQCGYHGGEPCRVSHAEFARAIERAHGIGAQAPESTRPADASISGQRVDMTGWRLVPVEPTQEMQRAAFDELELIGTPTESGTSMRNRVYRAMLAAAPQAPAPTPAHHVVDLFDAYKQACNLVEWANAAGTMMESPQALHEAAAALRDTLGRATHIAPQAPAEPAAQAVEQHATRDTRKLCTCDGAGRGPGRACVVKAGGRLGELWRCVEGATPAAREAGTTAGN